jgi:DnaJ like chaperone protein
MAAKHHPDKVATLGEDVQRAAKEKFQKVNEAYEKIRRQRGIV